MPHGAATNTSRCLSKDPKLLCSLPFFPALEFAKLDGRPRQHASSARPQRDIQLQDKVTEIIRWNLWKAEPNIWVHDKPVVEAQTNDHSQSWRSSNKQLLRRSGPRALKDLQCGPDTHLPQPAVLGVDGGKANKNAER